MISVTVTFSDCTSVISKGPPLRLVSQRMTSITQMRVSSMSVKTESYYLIFTLIFVRSFFIGRKHLKKTFYFQCNYTFKKIH